jgi:(2Fe-2S) ferredoxin
MLQRQQRQEDVEEIIQEHLVNGRVVERLKI